MKLQMRTQRDDVPGVLYLGRLVRHARHLAIRTASFHRPAIDHKADAGLRAAAQGLITFITYGLGMFVGSCLSGAVVQHYALSTARGAVTYDWKSIWIFSAVVSAAVLLFFLVSFSEKSQLSAAEETGHLDVPVVSDALPQ